MGIIEQVAEVRYEEGVKIGAQKANRLFVEYLLKEKVNSMTKIASIANVTLSFVKKVKKDLAPE